MLDLRYGTLDGTLSAHPLDGWLQAADGSLLCLCRTVSPARDGFDAVTVRLVRADARGASRGEVALFSIESRDPNEAPDEPPGAGTSVHGAVAPDGRTLLVGATAHTRGGWAAFVLSVDLESAEASEPLPILLGDIPVDASGVDIAWAAIEAASDDGRAIATVSIRTPELRRRMHVQLAFGRDALRIERVWPGDPADRLRRCRGSAGPFLVDGDALQLCLRSWPPDLLTLRRFAPDGTVAGDTSLGLDDGGLVRGEWRALSDGRLVHWDPLDRRVSVLNASSASLATWADALGGAMTPATTPAGPTMAVDERAGVLYLLATADPVAVGSDPVRSPTNHGVQPRTISVHSLEDAALLARWDTASTASSIAVTDDGRYLLVSVAPSDAEPYPTRHAGVIAYDAASGEVRLVAGRLGEVPIRFVGDASVASFAN